MNSNQTVQLMTQLRDQFGKAVLKIATKDLRFLSVERLLIKLNQLINKNESNIASETPIGVNFKRAVMNVTLLNESRDVNWGMAPLFVFPGTIN